MLGLFEQENQSLGEELLTAGKALGAVAWQGGCGGREKKAFGWGEAGKREENEQFVLAPLTPSALRFETLVMKVMVKH